LILGCLGSAAAFGVGTGLGSTTGFGINFLTGGGDGFGSTAGCGVTGSGGGGGAASCGLMFHISASTATGVTLCQDTPIHKNASRMLCTSNDIPIARQRPGCGGI
jgi:hypothetical protein